VTVLTFLPRFAPKVKDGSKPRTIRAPRKRPIKAGMHLSLRQWSARPYASPQVVLREATCARVRDVDIESDLVRIFDPLEQTEELIFGRKDLDAFAVLDGFTDWPDMVAHFNKARGLPFRGVLIEWKP
jgi:hypothetical protein